MHAHTPLHTARLWTPFLVPDVKLRRGAAGRPGPKTAGQQDRGGGGGGEGARWGCLCSLGASMRDLGLSEAGGAARTSMAVKLLFWELEKHLKR